MHDARTILAITILAAAMPAQDPAAEAPRPSIPPRAAAEVAAERLFLESAVLQAAADGALGAADFSISFEVRADASGDERRVASISFRGGRDARRTPASFHLAVVRGVTEERERGWQLDRLDVQFDAKDAGSETPAQVRLIAFAAGPSVRRIDAGRALATLESTIAGASLGGIACRPVSLRFATANRKGNGPSTLRLEFELIGENFRSGFGALSNALAEHVGAEGSPFAAVRTTGREQISRDGTGAGYDLQIELREAGRAPR